jgi:molecular chaperone DnaK
VADPTAVGIDLGTTLSVVAQVDQAGKPVVLPNADGSPTTPSAVFFDGGKAIVGAGALESLTAEPELVVRLVKRHMGDDWSFDYQGVSYRPEHIAAIILRKLLADARPHAGQVSQAAVTVPAYFNDPMRAATRRAAELAGIDVLGLLSEPTAAALAFGYQRRPAGATGVVVDLGGGTFDVTVMDYDGNDLAVRATGGDYYLGGANFDRVLFDLFADRFRAAHGLDVTDPDALSLEECTQVAHDWLQRASRAKHELSGRENTVAALPAGGLLLRAEVDRAEFLARSGQLLDEIGDKIIDVLGSAGLQPADADFVLAVGGSTRIPAVRERVSQIFGKPPDTSVSPDEAVALGAALFAARRQLEQGSAPAMAPAAREYLENLTVTDVAAHSLGISVFDAQAQAQAGPPAGGHIMLPLLPRNTGLPVDISRTFYTMRPGEQRILVPILEGEDADPVLCRRIGEVVVDGLPAGRPAYQEVVVTMQLDRDGILRVAAADVATGTAASTTIVRGHQQLSPDADRAVRAMAVRLWTPDGNTAGSGPAKGLVLGPRPQPAGEHRGDHGGDRADGQAGECAGHDIARPGPPDPRPDPRHQAGPAGQPRPGLGRAGRSLVGAVTITVAGSG